MKIKQIKHIVTAGTVSVQLFCAIFFLVRGVAAIVFTLMNGESFMNPVGDMLNIGFEVIWLGLVPIIIFGLIRKFLHGLLDHQLFTRESCFVTRNLFVATSIFPVLSIVWDIFIGQKHPQNFLECIDFFILPYLDDMALVAIFAVLYAVIKNGRSMQEDVDGII